MNRLMKLKDDVKAQEAKDKQEKQEKAEKKEKKEKRDKKKWWRSYLKINIIFINMPKDKSKKKLKEVAIDE